MTQDIKILKIRRIFNGEGRNLKGFADVQVGDWTVNEWRIFQKEGERISIVVPQATWKDKEGKWQYRAIISIPGELRQQIEVAIISAWREELKGEKGKEE